MPPELRAFDWMLICIAVSSLAGLAVFFFKNIFHKNDKQSDDINGIQKDYAQRAELNNATAALRAESKAMDAKISEHQKAINRIEKTYVTKDELRELKTEFREEIKKLAADVDIIKNNYLTESRFIRSQSATDQKLDKMYDLLLSRKE